MPNVIKFQVAPKLIRQDVATMLKKAVEDKNEDRIKYFTTLLALIDIALKHLINVADVKPIKKEKDGKAN